MPKAITCDTCGANLTVSGNSIDYRLALLNERIPSSGGMVTDMMKYPAFDHDYYFCGSRCMFLWAAPRVAISPVIGSSDTEIAIEHLVP